ncbi:MAG: hypothetical protein NUW06_02430 [Candidatus Acetothermia bacterium]|jgi:hypothetical protein|nr:hypothetical protein [Candidatus Acetothermia bacterium]MDH7504578.1 hypothetical protein [Candidatus Acetothermia bacterium]
MRWRLSLLVVLALSVAFTQAGWARSLEELVLLAGTDALPEVRAAAGLALGELLVDSPFSDSDLEEMAVEGPSPELRAAAGTALKQRLLAAGRSLGELERLASGPTPELRAAAGPALVQAIVAAVGRGELSLEMLASSVPTGASRELRLARAEAVFLLLRAELVAPAAQAAVEAVLRGERVRVSGVELDGSLEEVRAAASDFLAGIYKFYGFLNRLQDPLADLMAVATDGSLTPEFRAAAAEALRVVFLARRARAQDVLQRLEGLLDDVWDQAQGRRNEEALRAVSAFQELLEAERAMVILTSEVAGEFTAAQRLESVARNAERMAALIGVDLAGLSRTIGAIRRDLQVIEMAVERAPDVPLELLQEWASSGATPELRKAAGAALGERFLEAGLTFDQLFELTANGPSPELRAGAGEALSRVLISMDLGEVELLRLIARHTTAFGLHPGTSLELGEALSRALARRLKEDLQT